MLSTILSLALVAIVLWVVWTLWQNGWDVKKAGAAIVAVAMAAWLWLGESVNSLIGSM